MNIIKQDVIPLIESMYSTLTNTEKTVADFFINNKDVNDFGADKIANHLHVSISSLTRFAKKCGFSGYRDFIFQYKESRNSTYTNHSSIVRRVLIDYSEIIEKTFTLINESQLERITRLFADSSKIYIYGIGSSGFAAKETKYRFMRLGLNIEAITDTEMMAMNHVVLDRDCFVVGYSISGRSEVVMDSLNQAKRKGAKTMLITSNAMPDNHEYFDEIVVCASMDNLDLGNRISPQLPILLVIDVIYDYIMELDRKYTGNLFKRTLSALNKESDDNDGQS